MAKKYILAFIVNIKRKTREERYKFGTDPIKKLKSTNAI